MINDFYELFYTNKLINIKIRFLLTIKLICVQSAYICFFVLVSFILAHIIRGEEKIPA